MNQSITDGIFSQLEGGPLRQMAQQLGIGPAQMAGAVSAALPLLIGALGKNASQPQGAQQLFGALQEDHANADLSSVLQGGTASQDSSSRMLGHIFGARQPRAEQTLGQATGLGQDKANMMLRWLAPVAMAYLAKRIFDKRQQAGGVSQPAGQQLPQSTGSQQEASPRVLEQVLGQERQRIGQQGGLGAGLQGILDQDGDGDVDFNDLLGLGGKMMSGRPQPQAGYS